jgi:hypothetical protein
MRKVSAFIIAIFLACPGTIMAYAIDDHSGTNLHFDAADTTNSGAAASKATATATGSYNILAFHALSY